MTKTCAGAVSRCELSLVKRRLLFDRQDHRLIQIVNDVLDRKASEDWKKTLEPYLHPHGIKEMASTFGLRVAYSTARVLDSLETGKAEERLEALRSLRDEVLLAPQSPLQYNTSRVLLQIMKELVRSQGDYIRQLKLAHDFRRCISGKPRRIRAQLDKYRLLEMQEDFTHMAFDDHVHDAYTKGRKSPSHLIMDAWIKGLRKITLVYYNHIPENVAHEVLEAAKIMDVSVRIGIEMRARHMGRYVKFIWTPRGLQEPSDFISFLNKDDVRELMEKGRIVSAYQHEYVWKILDKYNSTIRHAVGKDMGWEAPLIDKKDFISCLGPGQPNLDQLGNYISMLLPQEAEEKADPEYILANWLAPDVNPDISNPFQPAEDAPALLHHTPSSLVSLLGKIHFHNWIILDPENLDTADIILTLYHCKGSITHIETFNLKEYTKGNWSIYQKSLDILSMLNGGNDIRCKRMLAKVLHEVQQRRKPGWEEKQAELADILENLHAFSTMYRNKALRSRVGTDSTGRPRLRHGMGFVVLDTLPGSARRRVRKNRHTSYKALPLSLDVSRQIGYRPVRVFDRGSRIFNLLQGSGMLGHKMLQSWIKGDFRVAPSGKGNIYTLGGKGGGNSAITGRRHSEETKEDARLEWMYLNSHLKNCLKILMGLLPAAISFYLTKNWWVLAWFGAIIWFTITGFRNIVQSVLGCGGIRRSPFLQWKDLVNWDRFSDSLLFTGFSVPLLDWLVKSVILDQGFGINTTTNPLILYTVMALVNGAYISGHNIFRGLPRSAVVGNLFRSVLSIPLAFLFNMAIGGVLAFYGVAAVDVMLQKWAAIISKFASDCIAGIIEGFADRSKYIFIRKRDVGRKLEQIVEIYTRLELMYPQDDILELLEMPQAFIETISSEQKGLEGIVIVNALDMMYLWMYQPRTRLVVRRMLHGMTPDERRAFLLSQYILQREKEISVLLANGLIGKNFARALAFYLGNYKDYLHQIQKTAAVH